MHVARNEAIIEKGRRFVTPFVNDLHALHYPEAHREPDEIVLPDGRIVSLYPPSPEQRIADPNTTVREKSEAIGFNFRHVGEAVEANVAGGGLMLFCLENMQWVDHRDLTEKQGSPFVLAHIMPPEDVIHAMFRHFAELHHDDCPALEGYISGLPIAEQQLTLV